MSTFQFGIPLNPMDGIDEYMEGNERYIDAIEKAEEIAAEAAMTPTEEQRIEVPELMQVVQLAGMPFAGDLPEFNPRLESTRIVKIIYMDDFVSQNVNILEGLIVPYSWTFDEICERDGTRYIMEINWEQFWLSIGDITKRRLNFVQSWSCFKVFANWIFAGADTLEYEFSVGPETLRHFLELWLFAEVIGAWKFENAIMNCILRIFRDSDVYLTMEYVERIVCRVMVLNNNTIASHPLVWFLFEYLLFHKNDKGSVWTEIVYRGGFLAQLLINWLMKRIAYGGPGVSPFDLNSRQDLFFEDVQMLERCRWG